MTNSLIAAHSMLLNQSVSVLRPDGEEPTGFSHHQQSRYLPEQHRATEMHHSGTAKSPKRGIEQVDRITSDDENLIDLFYPLASVNRSLL